MSQSKRVVFRSRWLPWLLLAPQALVIGVFFFWPASQALLQSLQQQDAFGLSTEWVGLANFRALLDDPVGDSGILLFLLGRLLRPLLGMLASRGQGVGQLQARLHQDLARRRPSLELEARPATPTLDEALLADLLRLRLEASRQGEARAASYVEAEVGVQGMPIAESQLRVFREHAGRDLEAAARAMARVAAEFGPGAVVRAVLRQAHLPEASFAWEPLQALPAAQPRTPARRVLVRRVPLRPLPLAQRPFRERDDGWMVPASGDDASREASHARVDSITTADVVSGGWWNREVHREYHYAVTSDGEVLWVYRDLARGRWFLAGKVE